MTEEINEPIHVLVKFEKGKIYPFRFSWRGRDYRIQRIEFLHSTKQGEIPLYFFSAVCSEATYQIIFNSKTFSWRLGKIEVPGA